MVNWDILSIVIFYGLLFLFYLGNKKKFTFQGKIIALYKTKLGIRWMDLLAHKFPRTFKIIGFLGVFVGIGGMIYILIYLVTATANLLFVPEAAPALAPVLPGIDIPGAPRLSFWHWIIAIFFTAVIHEFSHGVLARVHKVRVKSSGFAFFGPILAAFVEPEEKELEKRSTMQQLSIFSAGPFSNILISLVILLFAGFVLTPLISDVYNPTGITVASTMDGYPMNATGIDTPFTITSINDQETATFNQFLSVMGKVKPKENISIGTDKGTYTVTTASHPDNASAPFLGISSLTQSQEVKEEFVQYQPFIKILSWFNLLVLWLFVINLGVGLFNLLPLGPVDGGRIFYTLALAIFKDDTKAKKVLGVSSLLCIALIVINMLPWINKLLAWLWSLITFLV